MVKQMITYGLEFSIQQLLSVSLKLKSLAMHQL